MRAPPTEMMKALTLVSLLTILTMTVHVGNGQSLGPVPEWKSKHETLIANANRVCSSPFIDENVNPQNLTTGFYTINLIAGQEDQYITIDDGARVSLSGRTAPTHWLLSRVGRGLYTIASCNQGAPMCLALAKGNHIGLQQCASLGYGDQVWWLKGLLVGPEQGGWYLGNDGLGFMECLVATNGSPALGLQECREDHMAWRFNRVEKPR